MCLGYIWFCADNRCDQLLSRWKNKDEWLGANSESKLSELWHGKRWKELAYFWDCKQPTVLPERCQQCNQIIRTSTITEAVSDPKSCLQITLTCAVCKSENILVPRYMQGDPRNQAILIHKDGWAPHSTSSKHSIAAITITKACMSKLDRSRNKNAQVYSFIPVNQLPKDSPHKFDAFFDPLLTEIEDLYMYSLEVFYKSAIPDFSAANDITTLRLTPLLVTADLHAHSE